MIAQFIEALAVLIDLIRMIVGLIWGFRD